MPRTCTSCKSPNQIPDDAKFCPACGAKVEAKAAAVDSSPAATQLDAPRAFAGRFMADGRGIEGPLGTTLAATDLSAGGAPVRLVLVNQAVLPSVAVADRALREWKQLAKVATPRVVKVIDQGRLDDGRVYVASEPPRGRALDEIIAKEGPLSVERVKQIVTQVGEALTEAQKVGVIHRDVAPGNIYVDGNDVSVAEFGLAEAVNDKVFGTPAFLSPEQAEGKPVDQRSNIYSLGAVIYYMLTGKPPFEGDAQSLLSQHASATPPAPSTKRAGLPVEIDRIVMKALEKSGGRRHLTLRQLISEVETVPLGGGVVRSEELGRATTLAAEEPPKSKAMAATVLGMAAPTAADIRAAQQAQQPSSAHLAKTNEQPALVEAAAKTMMAEAPKITAPTPVVSAATVMAEAPKVTAPTPAAAAATMMAEAPKITAPTPVVSAATVMAEAPKVAAPTPAKPAPQPVQGKKPAQGGFRETAWFKKGEIEEELAKAQASSSDDPLAPTGKTGQQPVYDEASVDVSSQDAKRLSLKTGATQMMQAIKVGSGASQALPGERMDEADMIAEIDRSRRWFAIAGGIVLVAIIGLVIALATRKSPPAEPGKGAEAPAPKAAVEPSKAEAPTAAAPKAEAPSELAAPKADEPAKAAEPDGATILAEAEAALKKGDHVLAVDALLRASRANADAAQLGAAALAAQKALADAATKAKKKKDRAGEAEAHTLAAKLKPLLPAAAAAAKGKHASKATARRR